MRVVFLDIDGVLNDQEHLSKLTGRRDLPQDEGEREYVRLHPSDDKDRVLWHYRMICSMRVALLQRLIDSTRSVIVISSSWRLFHPLDELRMMLKCHGLISEVIDVTPSLRWIYGVHGEIVRASQRGDEIRTWLEQHQEVTSFVVLDDDDDMLGVEKNHVMTSFVQGGLTDDHVECAISLLGT